MAFKIDDRSASLCGNCCNPVIDKSATTIEVDDCICGVNEVQIADALAYIYGISFEEFKTWKSSTEREIIPVAVSLCDSCFLLLTHNYVAHKKFEKETHPTSIVSEINAFRQRGKLCKEMVDEKSAERDNHSDDNQDLFDAFHYEDKEDEEGEDAESENKYEPEEEKSADEISESDQTSRVTRSSSKPPQVEVKLEVLSGDVLINYRLSRKKKEKKKSIKRKSKSGRSETRRKRKRKTENAENEIGLDSNERLEAGDLTESGEQSYKCKCKVCGKKFVDRNYFKYTHLPKHFKDMTAKCDICQKVFQSRLGVKRHKKKVHIDEEEKEKLKVPCDICGSVLHPTTVKAHMRLQHSGSRQTFKCNSCEKVFLLKQNYDEHLLTHLESFTPFLCGLCGKTFNTKNTLSAHEKTHTAEKRYPCPLCPLKFTIPAYLKKHMYAHSTTRQFVCDECGKTFKFKGHLRDHLKVHKEIAEKGEMSAKCDECGKFFKHSLSLYKHKGKVHQDESKKKVYSCSFCGKLLSSGSDLRIHEDRHRNNPDYQPRKIKTLKYQEQSVVTNDIARN